jgi:hypothetical protein
MSDAPMPSDPGNPRSGSGARRKKYIKEKMEQAIAAGELPPHCKNCGEIDTPTWRKAFTRVEEGTPNNIEISKDATGTGIIAYEVIEPSEENGGLLSYRVFKNKVTREELDGKKFEDLNLCNPCGLWLIKKGSGTSQIVERSANARQQLLVPNQSAWMTDWLPMRLYRTLSRSCQERVREVYHRLMVVPSRPCLHHHMLLDALPAVCHRQMPLS